MGKRRKLLQRILSGRSDTNIPFEQTRNLLKSLGFEEIVSGSHHVYRKEGIPEKLVLQPKEAKAKPYQVRQIRDLLVEYGLEEV